MENLLDMKSLYLYNDGYRYRVGRIVKVNEKSVRMEFGVRIDKDDFENIYKLSEEETKIYRGELIKALSTQIRNTKDFITDLKALKTSLRLSYLSCVDSTKLKDRIDELENEISKALPTIMEINGHNYKFGEFSEEYLICKDSEREAVKWV